MRVCELLRHEAEALTSPQVKLTLVGRWTANLDLPLLDLVERLELGNGDEDNDSLLATLNVDLTRRRDLERRKLVLEVRDVGLEVQESLSNLLLDLGGGGAGRVGRADDLGGVRHGAGCQNGR